MSVCPFCKAPSPESSAPCPRCGKLASEHPSVSGTLGRTLSTDFADDVPDLDLGDVKSSGPIGGAKAATSFESQGRTLDDDFDDDAAGGELELDVPAGRPPIRGTVSAEPPPPPGPAPMPAPPPAPVSSGRPLAAAVPSAAPGAPAAPPSSPAFSAPPAARPPPPKPSPAAIVAKYPPPPEKVWETPIYAWKVLFRQLELRQDLASLRKRRSPDVPLYEAALRAHDQKTFVLGLALTCAGLAVAGFVFFLPVFLRQLGD